MPLLSDEERTSRQAQQATANSTLCKTCQLILMRPQQSPFDEMLGPFS